MTRYGRWHQVRFTLTAFALIECTVTCDAPDGSYCRMAPTCECEERCEHPLEPYTGCNVVDWLTAETVVESYDGDTTPLRDGVITPSWDGDALSWVYADPAPAW